MEESQNQQQQQQQQKQLLDQGISNFQESTTDNKLYITKEQESTNIYKSNQVHLQTDHQGKVDDQANENQYQNQYHEDLENIIEQQQIIDNLEYNYQLSEVDQAIEAIMNDVNVSDQHKKSLYFISSDQEMLFENMNQLEKVTEITTNQMLQMQSELDRYKNMLSERETELKIMKRERDEYLTAKVEITLDYKKVKSELEIYQKHFEALEEVNQQKQIQQQQQLQNQVVHPANDQQSKLSKMLPSLFGVGKKAQTYQDNSNMQFQQQQQQKQQQSSNQHQRNNSQSFQQLQMHPGIPHLLTNSSTQQNQLLNLQQSNTTIPQVKIIDEQFENEQKEVIQIMQDQIQVKIKELSNLQKINDESNIELGRVKGLWAREKERSEDLSTDLEIYTNRLKKTEEQLQQKEKEVETLKQELQKVRSTSEQEIKKLKKAQQNSAGTNANNITTGGSNEIVSARIGNQNVAYDPYSSRGNASGQQNLNQSVLLDYHNVLNSQRDNFKTRESVLKTNRQQQLPKQDMNQSVMINNNSSGFSGGGMGMSNSTHKSKVIDLNSTYQGSSLYDNPFEQSTASSSRGGAQGVGQNNFSSNNSTFFFNSNGPVRSRLFGQKNTNQQQQYGAATTSIQNALNNSLNNVNNSRLSIGRKSTLNMNNQNN